MNSYGIASWYAGFDFSSSLPARHTVVSHSQMVGFTSLQRSSDVRTDVCRLCGRDSTQRYVGHRDAVHQRDVLRVHLRDGGLRGDVGSHEAERVAEVGRVEVEEGREEVGLEEEHRRFGRVQLGDQFLRRHEDATGVSVAQNGVENGELGVEGDHVGALDGADGSSPEITEENDEMVAKRARLLVHAEILCDQRARVCGVLEETVELLQELGRHGRSREDGREVATGSSC